MSRIALFCVILPGMLAISAAAQAATITVNVLTDSGIDTEHCELRSAIQAANTNSAVDACQAGENGVIDQIDFSESGEIIVTSDLPVVTESLNIKGTGRDQLSISGGTMFKLFDFGLSSGDHEISNLTLSNAVTPGTGACIKHRGNSLLIEDINFTNCTASGTGGALLAQGDTTMNRLLFRNNTSVTGGGAIRFENGVYAITDSSFIDNSVTGASFHGGAINLRSGGELTISRSTFYQNSSAANGGAIYSSGNLTLTSSTLVRNLANSDDLGSGYGGGVYFLNGGLALSNNVVSGNLQLLGNAIIFRPDLSAGLNTSVNSAGHNWVGINAGVSLEFPAGMPNQNGDYVGSPQTPIEAYLQGPDDFGGVTPTLRPLLGSPLVDQGMCPGELADQRGVSNNGFRIVDNPPENPADGCDIGAVELEIYIEDIFEDGFES